MTDLVLRNVDDRLLADLEAVARNHGHSVEAELKMMLSRGKKMSHASSLARARSWHQHLSDRAFPDSATMIRQDRDR